MALVCKVHQFFHMVWFTLAMVAANAGEGGRALQAARRARRAAGQVWCRRSGNEVVMPERLLDVVCYVCVALSQAHAMVVLSH